MPATAVGPDLVVVGSPYCDALVGLLQRIEPVLIPTCVAESSVEALDLRVLRCTAWLNQDVSDALLLHPRHERPASEFRSVVGSDFLRLAPKHGGTV